MKKTIFDEAGVVALLRKKQGKISQKDYAVVVGISSQYLSDIYQLRRMPGPSVLKYLGLERGYWRKPA